MLLTLSSPKLKGSLEESHHRCKIKSIRHMTRACLVSLHQASQQTNKEQNRTQLIQLHQDKVLHHNHPRRLVDLRVVAMMIYFLNYDDETNEMEIKKFSNNYKYMTYS